MLESALERRVCEYVKRCGGRALKFVSPGSPGVPDRICFFPGGDVVLIELKRPGRTNGLSVQQKKTHAWLRALGQEVWVVDDFEELVVRLAARGHRRHEI